MVPYEDRVTGVDLTDDETAGRAGLDDHRRRRHAPRHAAARARAPTPRRRCRTARRRTLGDRLNIRATEFTIGANGPAAMPGELPPTSAYTYAVEYSVDEANKDQARRRPVRQADRHLRRQPASASRPARRSRWATTTARRRSGSPAKDGVVIKIVSRGRRPRGRSTSPATASPTPARRSPRSASTTTSWPSSAELYDPGKSLWRAAITHFTPWDYNWPYGLPGRRRRPRPGRPGRRRPRRRRPVRPQRLDHPLRGPGPRRAGRRSPARRTRSPTSPTACRAAAPATRSRSR